jgi:hypothetical protein
VGDGAGTVQRNQEYTKHHMDAALVDSEAVFKMFGRLCCVKYSKIVLLPWVTWWVMWSRQGSTEMFCF